MVTLEQHQQHAAVYSSTSNMQQHALGQVSSDQLRPGMSLRAREGDGAILAAATRANVLRV